MKKSVRIRKALPGEQPGYYNKTAKFLKKAQMGMQVDSPTMDPQRLNTIYTNVYAALKADTTPDVVYSSLISQYALDEQTALGILRSVLGKLAEEGAIDPSSLEGNNSQQKGEGQAQPSETQDRESQEQYDQRMSEDAEQDELAMSDEGYYDEEEAANNSSSHLETEEDEQQQAFRFGGYYDDGGESDEDYSEYYDDSDQSSSTKKAVINQYNDPGQNKTEKPFSIQDLIGMTPGIQGMQASPGIEDYLNDYRPISQSYSEMDYLPRAQTGGSGLIEKAKKMAQDLGKGYDFIRKISPMTNTSGIRKLAPIATLAGEALTKIPYFGPKLQPELKTSFTQNRNHLWEVLNGAEPNKEIFSNVGSVRNADGTLQANRLLLYQEDLRKIIEAIEDGKDSQEALTTFKLGDIQPFAAADGLVSGIYPMDSKITSGVDDQGNTFFEISHVFGPNQTLPFGTTSSKAKELKLKNRFYYKTEVDPESGTPINKVFGPLGEQLTAGTQTKYRVKRPLLPSAFMSEADTLLRDPNTPFPNFTLDFGRNPNGPLTSGIGRIDLTSTPPATVDRLGARGKIGRALENFTLSTYIPQIFGLGNPLRTSPKNVDVLNLPTLGYSNSALGPNVLNPAGETGVYDDIRNAMNYKYRIGRNALLGLGAIGTTGYMGYQNYVASQCQCEDPTKPYYQPKDEYGNCTCNTDVGARRVLDPTGVEPEVIAPENELNVPDSMKFLIEQGLYPTEQNYYRYKGKNKRNEAVDYKKGGSLRKLQPGGVPGNPGGVAELGRRGLNTAEQFFNAYQTPSFYGTMSPFEIKRTARGIQDLPEWIRREQAAQQLVNHWPTHSEIQDMLDIQRRILNGEFGMSDVIPTAAWRNQISGGRSTSVPPITSITEMQNLAQDFGLVDINGNPISSTTAGQQTPILQPGSNLPFSNISSLTYDQLRALTEDQLAQLSQNINYPFTVTGNEFVDRKTGKIMPGGRITLNKHPSNSRYSFNTPYYGFYANMQNPVQAGRTFDTILKYGLDEVRPSIMEDGSLSLDSFNIHTNVGTRNSDWMIHPPEGTVSMNNMAVHHPLKDIHTFRSYTADEIDEARMLLDNMMAEKGLIDMFGDAARMTIKPYNSTPDPSGDLYDFRFPNYRVQRLKAKGGITEKQFVKAFSSKFQDGGPQDQSLGKGNRMDTLTNDVESRKNIFKSKLKDNSNVALTKEIYKNAQGNPQILNMLMQDGPKENLAEDTGMQTTAYGGTPNFYNPFEAGGFVDMDAENPLVRFIYGGDETDYYQPEDLPEAQFGNMPSPTEMYDYVENVQKNHPELANNDKPNTGFETNPNNDDIVETFHNCPQGYVWNATYNSCIPVAKINYNPRVVRGQSGAFRNLAPWNPAFGYAGSWAKQKSLPYLLNNKNLYTGPLTGAPDARYVTKKGMFGQPKKWIDIYDVNNTGKAINPLEIEQLMNQKNKGPRRVDTSSNRNNTSNNEPSRRDMLRQTAMNEYGFNENEWQDERGSSRRDMMRDVRQDMRADRRESRMDDGQRRFPRMRATDTDRNPRSSFAGMFANRRKSQYGGNLNEYGPGGQNDPSYPGGYNPYTLGQGFSVGVGQNTSAFAPHSADAQFQNELMGGNGPSKLPPQQQNDFAFVTGTGLGSYAETANTGHTLGAQGQEIIPEKVNPEPERNLVGVERKRKNTFNFDPESALNQVNAGARGLLNLFDPEKKRQCGPGTTWNSDKQICESSNAMDIYSTATEKDKGDYVAAGSKLGLYRYDQMGQDRDGRSTFGQYGGYMQDGGQSKIDSWKGDLNPIVDPRTKGRTMEVSNSSGTPTYMVYDQQGQLIYTSKNKVAAQKVLNGGPTVSQNFQYGGFFEEDEEVMMTPEELEQFLAAGGQVEYL
jgi:hypothetical protein